MLSEPSALLDFGLLFMVRILLCVDDTSSLARKFALIGTAVNVSFV
jgi:hypothetical protein